MESETLAEKMLSDEHVARVYLQFFSENAYIFKDKIVLDVGCQSGLLSYLACKAGAAIVFAVGNMQSAKCVSQALESDGKIEVFTPLAGSTMEEVKLPCGYNKVDIIVSEWIGHAILADSLFVQLLYARNTWLVPGGYIIPNVATLYIQGMSDHTRTVVEPKIAPVKLVDDYVDASKLMTDKFRLKILDLTMATQDDECIKTEFKLTALKTGTLTACLLHFEVGFKNAKGELKKLFSNGPETPRTYLKQTVLYLDENALEVAEKELLRGRLSIALCNCAPRGVELSLCITNFRPYKSRNQ